MTAAVSVESSQPAAAPTLIVYELPQAANYYAEESERLSRIGAGFRRRFAGRAGRR